MKTDIATPTIPADAGSSPSYGSAFLCWSAKAGYATCTSDIQLALYDAWKAGFHEAVIEHAGNARLRAALERVEGMMVGESHRFDDSPAWMTTFAEVKDVLRNTEITDRSPK